MFRTKQDTIIAKLELEIGINEQLVRKLSGRVELEAKPTALSNNDC